MHEGYLVAGRDRLSKRRGFCEHPTAHFRSKHSFGGDVDPYADTCLQIHEQGHPDPLDFVQAEAQPANRYHRTL
jgi:hypothetical protein